MGKGRGFTVVETPPVVLCFYGGVGTIRTTVVTMGDGTGDPSGERRR